MTRQAFYFVTILTPESGWTVSRTFATLAAARKWAKWCSQRWQAAIYKGGAGGERVADYPKAA